MNSFTVSNFRLNVFKVPTQRKLESDGTLEWESTTLVLVELNCLDKWGIGYTYGHSSVATVASTLLKKYVAEKEVFNIAAITETMGSALRNNGKTGISAMAISAIDIALWDLKAKLLNVSLSDLLGRCRERIEAYGSGGFTSYSRHEMQDEMLHWKQQGFRKFKMKVGRNPSEDLDRVQFVREIIGSKNSLMVDANEAFNPVMALAFAQDFARFDVNWFEQPISSTDHQGMKEIRQRFPPGMALASGEYIYSLNQGLKILQHRTADVLQLDVTRCLGITGFLKLAALAEAYDIPVSSHCAPTLHTCLGCAIPGFIHAEYFSDHARIEEEFFEGILPAKNGYLEPNLSRPGLGIEVNPSNRLEKYESHRF